MRIRAAAVVLAGVGLVAAGCGTWTQRDPGANALVSSLQVQVEDASVRLMLHVTNTTGDPVRLEFTSGQRYDFEVLQAGEPLWRWSEDQFFTMALGSEEIGAGQTRSYEARWEPGGHRGEFEAVGLVPATNRAIERRAEFRIP